MRKRWGLLALTAGVVFGLAGTAAAQVKIEMTPGTKARYKVAERLVGVNFDTDAVGSTDGVTGVIALKADGSLDSAASKLTVDMKSLSSDQTLRDMYLQMSVLQTAKFPTLEFVPTKVTGMPWPLPKGTPIPNTQMVMPSAAGFQLSGTMSYHGKQKEVTWNVVATISADSVSGRATTKVTFDDLGLAKPKVPLLASAEDTIQLEIEFRAKRTGN